MHVACDNVRAASGQRNNRWSADPLLTAVHRHMEIPQIKSMILISLCDLESLCSLKILSQHFCSYWSVLIIFTGNAPIGYLYGILAWCWQRADLFNSILFSFSFNLFVPACFLSSPACSSEINLRMLCSLKGITRRGTHGRRRTHQITIPII